MMKNKRTVHDSLGELILDENVCWGAQTQRAIENFPISSWKMPKTFLKSLALLKAACAQANSDLGILDKKIGDAIISVALDLAENMNIEEFPIDVFQTGSGTSTNMNMNEVIAFYVEKKFNLIIHPNDHVNMSQSSNDIIPSALHVSAIIAFSQQLIPSLQELIKSLKKRALDLDKVVKSGRTHLMDAVPLTFGQELSGWIDQLEYIVKKCLDAQEDCRYIALGGTAIGTELNAPKGFKNEAIKYLEVFSKEKFFPGKNLFSLISSQDRIVHCHGVLRTLSCALAKIAHDLRLMNSGPLSGFAEISLPTVQPGSSIMPGKVNPVILESALMVCFHVMGCDTALSFCGQSGNFQLNVNLPLIAHYMVENTELLSQTCLNMAKKAIDGFEVLIENVQANVAKNPILITALNRHIGYEKGAIIVKTALKEKRSLLDVAQEKTGYSREQLEKWLNPYLLTKSGEEYGENEIKL